MREIEVEENEEDVRHAPRPPFATVASTNRLNPDRNTGAVLLRAAKRRQLHQPNLGSEGRPTPRWQPLHASYAAGAADARSRAPCTLFLAATAARFVIEES